MNIRRIPLSGVLNLRDLGGYPVGKDKATRWKVFYRSDGFIKLSEEDEAMLLKQGIKTVIDLRSIEEFEKRKNHFDCHSQIQYHQVSLIHKGIDIKPITDLKELYLTLTEQSKEFIGKVFSILAEERDGGMVFHCTAGKDRTGIIASLLLSLSGVCMEDIVADYQISQTLLKSIIFDITEPTTPFSLLDSQPENIEVFMAYIENNYHTAENYLLSCGVTASEIEYIRKKFVAQAD